MRRLVSLLCGCFIVATVPLQAQELAMPALPDRGEELVDRVVAVVGDSAIYLSEVQEQVFRLEAAGTQIPDDPDAFRAMQREALEDMIHQTLVLNAASRDTTINIPEDRLDATVEDAWADQIQRFGSEAAFRQALEASGQTTTQYRANLRDEVRRSLMLQQYVQTRRMSERAPPVDEAAIREFYERERHRIGERPATLTFDQVVILPEPSDSVKALAREEAERILDMVREGEDFADLARRFSADPGSNQRGGELGWIRQGTMVEEFEDAAFRLGRGQVSGVVETIYGSHLIKVERVRGPERLVRHILIAAEPTDADQERARTRAIEIRDEVRAGSSLADFEDESTPVGLPSPLTMALDQLGQLPSGYASELQTAGPGDVLGPIEFPAPQGHPGFAVVRVQEVREAGEFAYEDVRAQIREILEDEQFEQRLIQDLMDRTYVDIRW